MAVYTATAPSKWVDLDGPVHYVDHGGPAGAPLVVLVHGLGGSHANWAPFAALLSQNRRVLAVDLPGFGLTPGRPRSTKIPANRRILTRFLSEVTAGEPVVLIGNSMGGLISALHASRAPETVSQLVLVDPAMPVRLTLPDPLLLTTIASFTVPPSIGRKLRQPPTVEAVTRRILRLCVADPDAIPRDVLDQHVALARARADIPGADADFEVAARSLGPFLIGRRTYDAMLDCLTMPVLLISGRHDRLIPITTARRLAASRPEWTFVEATDCGHVAMLEKPQWTADVVERFLS